MATKTISITEEAYERLNRRKKDRESFSEVINRLAGKRDLSCFSGILTEKEAKELEEAVENSRKTSRERFAKTACDSD